MYVFGHPNRYGFKQLEVLHIESGSWVCSDKTFLPTASYPPRGYSSYDYCCCCWWWWWCYLLILSCSDCYWRFIVTTVERFCILNQLLGFVQIKLSSLQRLIHRVIILCITTVSGVIIIIIIINIIIIFLTVMGVSPLFYCCLIVFPDLLLCNSK